MKTMKSSRRPSGSARLATSGGPSSIRRRRLPSAQRMRCRHRAPADSTACSTTVTSGASATRSPCRVRRVDISRSSVSAVGDQPPTASSAVAADEHPVAAQLGGAVGRPAAALAGHVHQLLLVLRRGQPAGAAVGVPSLDLEGRRIRVPRPGGHGARQEVRRHVGVGVDHGHHLAAHLRLRPGQHRALGARPGPGLTTADRDRLRCRRCGGASQLAGAVRRPIVKDQHVEAPLGRHRRSPAPAGRPRPWRSPPPRPRPGPGP